VGVGANSEEGVNSTTVPGVVLVNHGRFLLAPEASRLKTSATTTGRNLATPDATDSFADSSRGDSDDGVSAALPGAGEGACVGRRTSTAVLGNILQTAGALLSPAAAAAQSAAAAAAAALATSPMRPHFPGSVPDDVSE